MRITRIYYSSSSFKVLLSLLLVLSTIPLEYSEFLDAEIPVYRIEVALISFQCETPGDFEEGEMGEESKYTVVVKSPLHSLHLSEFSLV